MLAQGNQGSRVRGMKLQVLNSLVEASLTSRDTIVATFLPQVSRISHSIQSLWAGRAGKQISIAGGTLIRQQDLASCMVRIPRVITTSTTFTALSLAATLLISVDSRRRFRSPVGGNKAVQRSSLRKLLSSTHEILRHRNGDGQGASGYLRANTSWHKTGGR